MDSLLSTLQKCFAIFTIISVIPSILGYGVLSSIAITSLVLLLSSIILNFINQKAAILQESKKDEIFNNFSTEQQSRDEEEKTEEVEEATSTQQHLSLTQVADQESQPIEENLQRDTKSQGHGVNQVQIGPPKKLHSESESNGHSCSSLSEDSDMDWLYSGNLGQSREYSDDSISDEESLFEITLPNGQFVCPKQDSSNSNYFMQQKLQDFSSKTVFYQPKLIELFAETNEINEEENLIEIDLSMGSIKCSRFEIKA